MRRDLLIRVNAVLKDRNSKAKRMRIIQHRNGLLFEGGKKITLMQYLRMKINPKTKIVEIGK